MSKESRVIPGLDPGIVELVTFLRDRGVQTTDSGDGVTKADLIATGDALDVPHVHAVTTPDVMFEAANNMARLVQLYVSKTGDNRFADCDVQATYSTSSAVVTLSVFGRV